MNELKVTTESISKVNFIEKNQLLNGIMNNNSLIIIDSNVKRIHFPELNINSILELNSSESIKDLSYLNVIFDFLYKNNVNKDTVVYCIGGGTLSDLIGFASSVYKRGLTLNLVPTTLLAMADASIGGKNAVNYKDIKNLIGNYYLPKKVHIVVEFLSSLESEHYLSGLVEIIKIALTSSPVLFRTIHENREQILERNPIILKEIIELAIEQKIQIVKKDYKDSNERLVLNFGHTIGHAIELTEDMPHGFAVAQGIYAALLISKKLTNFKENDLVTILSLFDYFHIPYLRKEISKEILEKISHDKKSHNDDVNFILLEEIGKAKIHKISINELQSTIQNMFKS